MKYGTILSSNPNEIFRKISNISRAFVVNWLKWVFAPILGFMETASCFLLKLRMQNQRKFFIITFIREQEHIIFFFFFLQQSNCYCDAKTSSSELLFSWWKEKEEKKNHLSLGAKR